MLIAEIRNKLNYVDFSDEDSATTRDISRMEDVLTSNVFGILKNIDLAVFNEILKKAGIDELEPAPEFEFWPRYGDTEPDLVVKTLKKYILIEVKYQSDFDKGTPEKRPQILKEIAVAEKESKGQQVYFLAITREESLDWNKKIYQMPEYMNELENKKHLLHHISWQEIFEILKPLSQRNEEKKQDKISGLFLNDLVEYLETKEIGHIKVAGSQPDRNFEHFFGDEAKILTPKLEQYKYNINLNELPVELRKELYTDLKTFVDKLSRGNKLKKIKNTLATDKIPLEILFEVEQEELEAWTSLIMFLYTNEFVNMNGQSDFSVKLHLKKGNYTQSPVSLLRYRRKIRTLEFQKLR